MISDDYALRGYRQALLEATEARDVDWANKIFEEFWENQPSKDEFIWVMEGVLLTAKMLWTVGQE